MQEAVLTIDHVEKIYRRPGKPPVHAVKNLSMQVRRGEIVALLGSSGCGKTSTLRMIAGFEDVTSGKIELGGRRIDQLAPARRNVAMAFEGYSLYPPLTVRENIAFALKGSRMRADERLREVAEVTALVEIDPILDRLPGAISGGQQQRASLARALVRKADLCLLDEPMGQLEPQLRAVLRGRLKNRLVERGLTSIFVTHDQTEANALADRIAVMENGELQQFSSPRELKDAPANVFVATFIGEPPMNIFDARVVKSAELLEFAIDGGPALAVRPEHLSSALRDALVRCEAVRLGVRPHNVMLGTGGWHANVVSNQWLGDQTHVAAEVAGRLMVAVAHTRVQARAGSEIEFGFALQDVHVFDALSGTAITHRLVTP